MGTCWSKTRPCCKCAPSSASTRRTWARTSGALCSISEMSAASVAVLKGPAIFERGPEEDMFKQNTLDQKNFYVLSFRKLQIRGPAKQRTLQLRPTPRRRL